MGLLGDVKDRVAKVKAAPKEQGDFVNKIDLFGEGKILDAPKATYDEVIAAFKELLVYPDFDVVRVIFATLIANYLQTDAVWLFVVGPSASGKTELINAIEKIPGTYLIGLVTPNTFLSGFTKQGSKSKREASLLLRLPPQFVFLQKDFTSILALRLEFRNEILGQLREIFDGRFEKQTGEGTTKSWSGKAGFISGVTNEIENTIMTSAKFGDRFLYYRLPVIDEVAAMRRGSEVMFKAAELRENIQRKVCGYISSIQIPDKMLPLGEKVINGIQQVLTLVVRARAAINRDNYGDKRILGVNQPEGTSRFYKELLAVGQGFAIMNVSAGISPELGEKDYFLLVKLALDSIPKIRVQLMKRLFKYAEYVTTRALANVMKLPTNTVRYHTEELEANNLLVRSAEGGRGKADKWFMPEDVKKAFAFAFDIDGVQGEKEETPEDVPEEEPNAAADLVNKGWDDVTPPPV